MSYILDALRKSENARTRQEKAHRQSLQEPSSYSERSMGFSPWILLLLIFILSLFTWWFWPTLVTVVSDVRDTTNLKTTVNVDKASIERSNQNSAASASDTPEISTAESNSGVSEKQVVLQSADDPLPPGNELKELWQMPVDFQARIPEMIFSFHVYTDKPKSRTIIINDRRLKEGAMVNSKVRLRMITDTGVILHAYSRFFHVDVYEQMYVPTGN